MDWATNIGQLWKKKVTVCIQWYWQNMWMLLPNVFMVCTEMAWNEMFYICHNFHSPMSHLTLIASALKNDVQWSKRYTLRKCLIMRLGGEVKGKEFQTVEVTSVALCVKLQHIAHKWKALLKCWSEMEAIVMNIFCIWGHSDTYSRSDTHMRSLWHVQSLWHIQYGKGQGHIDHYIQRIKWREQYFNDKWVDWSLTVGRAWAYWTATCPEVRSVCCDWASWNTWTFEMRQIAVQEFMWKQLTADTQMKLLSFQNEHYTKHT